MKIYLDSIGCRLNQSEIETFARQFRSAGHTLVARAEEADLVVVNTCTVTAAAASDSRQKARQAARAGARQVVLTGCWATVNPDQAAALPAVSQVIPNGQKDHLVSELLQISGETLEGNLPVRIRIPGERARTRAFVKVQDGCDNHCTFCITTIARGSGRSRPIPEVLADVRAALGGGAREVVLTGVHLGSWGQDFAPQLHLAGLVKSILQETNLPRLRLSSLEPWDLNADFFSLWEDSRLCRHLHLPLQSGCAATLRRMARKTNPEAFAELVATARSLIPDVAITTDIIAGFPGEDDDEFNQSIEFVRARQFAGGHVLSYSARPGTAAARLPGQVPYGIRKERNARLRAVIDAAAKEYRSSFIGRIMPVLSEATEALGPHTWRITGLTDNYLRVRAETPYDLWNQIVPVHLAHDNGSELEGTVILPGS